MRAAACLCLLLLCSGPAAGADYPEIRRLDRGDLLFRQLQDDLEAWLRCSSRRDPAAPAEAGPALKIFQYRLREGDDLFALAARLNLPYDTLSSLNGLGGLQELAGRKLLLVPNLPGVFVPLEPETDFEWVVHAARADQAAGGEPVRVLRDGRPEAFRFLPGARFLPVERAYFLRILFRFPLPSGSLSSGYGRRESPIDGHPEFHNGIDIAAPEGTEVLAARGGRVTARGADAELGNYLQILHGGGYFTIYGHLSRWEVGLNDEVSSGMIIGRVGSTGLSTGPHLHFEIRRQGAPQDPLPLFPGGKDGGP